jgi:adenosylhomocysteine nucleosidase
MSPCAAPSIGSAQTDIVNAMAILYVASEAGELTPFAARLTGLRKLKWPIDYAFEGIWEGRRVMLAANGAGPKLAARAVEVAIRAVRVAELSSSKLETVASVGYCGALDPALRATEIVVASQILDLARGETLDCAAVSSESQFATGLIASQDRVAIDAEEKRRLLAHSAIAVDMEAAGVAARARAAGLPFCCIKVVSDCADESFLMDFNRMRTAEGRIARGKISLYAVTHPKLVPGLLRLRRRAREAAQSLGDFLVSCRIHIASASASGE